MITDWSEWVTACKRFSHTVDSWPVAKKHGPHCWEIEPPISEQTAARIENEMGKPFPPELREFYRTGSGAMNCQWYWNPPEEWAQAVRAIFKEDGVCGGPAIISAQRQIEHHSRPAEVLGDWLRYGKPTPQERTVAENLFPLVEISNGDELFLHVPESGRGGKVYCYYHEYGASESPLIEMAATFEAFLIAWERLYYIGPEGWMFTPFMEYVDGSYCRINTSLPNVRTWRTLVSDVSAGELPR